jgi:hypothetical protein
MCLAARNFCGYLELGKNHHKVQKYQQNFANFLKIFDFSLDVKVGNLV